MIRVLVVDDSPTVRMLLVKMLEADPEIEVVGQAEDGNQAVEMARKLKPDLVTMDLVMPGMGGLEATQRIMAEQRIPILFITGHANSPELNLTLEAVKAGALDIADKPVGLQALVGKVKALAGRRTVLVVEDNPTQDLPLKALLEEHGYCVTAASNGQEGLALVREQRPDIIVSDVTMPVMDGYQMCRVIKEDKELSNIPFVLLTDSADPQDVVKAAESRADHYITRPYNEDVLLSVVGSLIGSSVGMEFWGEKVGLAGPFAGDGAIMAAEPERLLNLFRSTFECAVRQNRELARLQGELQVLNEGLEKKVEERTRLLKTLHDIDQRVSSTLDVGTVLELLLEKIDDLFPHAATNIWLLNRESRRLEPMACRNIDEREWEEHHSKPPSVPCHSREVFETRTTSVIRNVQTDPQTRHPEFYRRRGLISYMGSPLIAKDEILGVISFYLKEEHDFSKEEVEFFSSLASKAAIAIHNSQLYEQLEGRTRELSALYSVATVVNQSLDFDFILGSVMHRVMEILAFDAASVYRYDEDSKEIQLHAQEGYPRDVLGGSLKPGKGIVGIVFSTGEPIFIRDIKTSPEYQSLARVKLDLRMGFRSICTIPIKARGKTVGVINVASKDPHRFLESEIQLINAIAEHVGIAMESVKLFEETKKQAVQLEKTNKVKDEFLSVMSHELRTPLTGVMGYTAITSDGLLGEVNERQKGALRKALKSSNDLLRLITSILDVTRFEGGVLETQIAEVDLKDFLDKLGSAYDYPIAQGVTLTWDFPSDLPHIQTDGDKLKAIVQNLTNNAGKFTHKGAVTVSARHYPEAGGVEFMVADTGIGIPKEALPTIFEKFRQLDSSETRSYGGVGLGLYIVKTYAELLGGDVEVESKVGKGSTFTVTLPCKSPG